MWGQNRIPGGNSLTISASQSLSLLYHSKSAPRRCPGSPLSSPDDEDAWQRVLRWSGPVRRKNDGLEWRCFKAESRRNMSRVIPFCGPHGISVLSAFQPHTVNNLGVRHLVVSNEMRWVALCVASCVLAPACQDLLQMRILRVHCIGAVVR